MRPSSVPIPTKACTPNSFVAFAKTKRFWEWGPSLPLASFVPFASWRNTGPSFATISEQELSTLWSVTRQWERLWWGSWSLIPSLRIWFTGSVARGAGRGLLPGFGPIQSMWMLLWRGLWHNTFPLWITTAMASHLFAPCTLLVSVTLGSTSTLFANLPKSLTPSSPPCVTMNSYPSTEPFLDHHQHLSITHNCSSSLMSNLVKNTSSSSQLMLVTHQIQLLFCFHLTYIIKNHIFFIWFLMGVTNASGLYRYRVGDILRVTGFKNKAPQFSFVCRKNVALSIDSDKTDEVELQNAMKNAVTHLVPFDAHVSEYTSYADTTTIPGHYVLYWELSLNGSTPIPPSVYEDCCLTIEESLNSVYRQGRVSDKSIGPLEIKIVEQGTFDKLMDYAISLGASINQYKAPRCVKFAPMVELLNSRVTSNYFSPKCPKWVPGHKQWIHCNWRI